jgi:hypothetical protein
MQARELIGKTISTVDDSSINRLIITFTDGTSITLEPEYFDASIGLLQISLTQNPQETFSRDEIREEGQVGHPGRGL